MQCVPIHVCVLRHLFLNVEFYCVRTGYGVMKSSQFCLKPDECVNVYKLATITTNLQFVYNFTELHLIICREQIDKYSIRELP